MRITTTFNIWMTLLALVYSILASMSDNHDGSVSLLDVLLNNDPIWGVPLALFLFAVILILPMYCIRALWNRLFPHLCGWKPISLAESYALSLIFAFVWV